MNCKSYIYLELLYILLTYELYLIAKKLADAEKDKYLKKLEEEQKKLVESNKKLEKTNTGLESEIEKIKKELGK